MNVSAPLKFTSNTRNRVRSMVTGITKDGTGTPVAGANVDVFSTNRRKFWGTTVSDANGFYEIEVAAPGSTDEDGIVLTFFAVAYKAGGTDLSGTTVNTLVANA